MAQLPKTSQGRVVSLSRKVRPRSMTEDSAAFTVSASSLTMAMEAVTHALRWIASRGDSQNTYAIILTDWLSFPDSHQCQYSGNIHLKFKNS